MQLRTPQQIKYGQLIRAQLGFVHSRAHAHRVRLRLNAGIMEVPAKHRWMYNYAIMMLKRMNDLPSEGRGRHEVTDHALIRMMERCMGVDIATLKSRLLEKVERHGGYELVRKDGYVVTIIPKAWEADK